MKLRKQLGAKLALVATTLAMLGAFFALVRSQPQLSAEASVAPSPAPGSYKDFFFPAGTPVSAPQGSQTARPAPARRPHTRTMAS